MFSPKRLLISLLALIFLLKIAAADTLPQDEYFAYNYLSGSIPKEWASMQLKSISLLVNRLSGNIPSYLGNFTNLTYLSLEANEFSGPVPKELGKLVNLKNLILSSNNLSGNLPMELAELKNVTDFRINDNNNGSIPDFIRSWRRLGRLEMQASGLKGPIPSSISVLEKKISDINGTNQAFPNLSSITGLRLLVLRNCNISGEIPQYIWGMNELETLDLSFNNLSGKLPSSIDAKNLSFVFLSFNLLNGDIPIIGKTIDVDLSYNNFTKQNPSYLFVGRQDMGHAWKISDVIADILMEKDFNIKSEASAVLTPITKKYDVNVSNGILEIRFYWAGKGTTRIPNIGNYGPLITISVNPNFNPQSGGRKVAPIVIGVTGSFLILLALGILWYRRYSKAKSKRQKDHEGLEIQTTSFTLKQIKAATNNFENANKIGEGGFGPVYKGLLADGTVIAVKQLSTKSSQGNREFLNEIGMIACLRHPNLVKLHGCCIEGDN
ncbi:hypothetical protein GH714_011585 [Hevea brasiliensis]|uniref:non-specific serine/threonine protein kinase n=1 Tax=Hevea brasiliensis TaxID=3981 RepID=A0A6A6LNE9_HEVBR|nr:hypothetical protein GH714_011585 [Hevea brasiliensis]